MKILKTLILSSAIFMSMVHADEISKKVCESFLPAFGDNNIDLINNGFKRDLQGGEEKHAKMFNDYMKVVNDSVSRSAQERCDKGVFPVMDLGGCYEKCKAEAAKASPGQFAWNVQSRGVLTNKCYSACTGAYVAQNAITKSIRKSEAAMANCGNTAIFDSKKVKTIEQALEKTPSTDESSAATK